MARRKTATKRRRGLFLDRLRQTGNVSEAAIAGELARGSWYELRAREPIFAQEWDDANMFYLDGLASVGVKRAVVGENEDVPYTHIDDKGNKVTRFRTINRKSDRLLELTLKARHPDYKPVRVLEQTSPDGSMTPPPANMPDLSALTDDELAAYTDLLRKISAAAGT